MIKIVNIKHGPKCKYLYIGRANQTYGVSESKWHNPFVIGKDGSRDEVIEKYRLWINSQPDLLISLDEIKKENFLGCWCDYPQENCHGSVLIELAESKYIKNWFSNMLPFDKPMVYQGIEFLTVENFYQAMKLPKVRTDLRQKIAKMSPFEAKKNIRDKLNFPWDSEWDRDKALRVMRYALEWKFQKGSDWYRKLMITKDLGLELVEWNNWSDVWYGKDIKTRKGENHLGKLLMEIRNNA